MNREKRILIYLLTFIFLFFTSKAFNSFAQTYCPQCTGADGTYLCDDTILPDCSYADNACSVPEGGDCNTEQFCELNASDGRWYCRPCGEVDSSGYCTGVIRDDEGGCGPDKSGQCGLLGGCNNPDDVCVLYFDYDLINGSDWRCVPSDTQDRYNCNLQEEIVCDEQMALVPRACGIRAGCVDFDYICRMNSSGVPQCIFDPAACRSEDCVAGECGLPAGCPIRSDRCVETENSLGNVLKNCQYDPQCAFLNTDCGALEQPCCVPLPGVPYGSEYYCEPNLVCRVDSGRCQRDYFEDSEPVYPGDGRTYERRAGHPYGGVFLDLSSLMRGIFKILYPVAIILGVAFFVKGGYAYMTSEGDPQKVKAAQGDISNAIVGTLFVLLSAAILRIIISSVLGQPISL